MTTEAELYAQILAAPEDDAPRRDYGLILEQRGDPRGELIRIQLRIAEIHRTEGPRDELAALTIREDELLLAHEEEWLAPLQGLVQGATLQRGFFDRIEVEAKRFVTDAAALFRKAPVLHLRALDAAPAIHELAASPYLQQLVSLDLYGQKIRDAGAAALAASPHLGRLALLELGFGEIALAGLESVFATNGLPKLSFLGFRDNLVEDPVDTPSEWEDDVIVGWKESTLGAQLEARYGEKPWMHYRSQLAMYWPPSEMAFVGHRPGGPRARSGSGRSLDRA
jgi:uncharacterized protein (TIGR02996 family)